jgi:quercetin dioxygenase-like cupin family protein
MEMTERHIVRMQSDANYEVPPVFNSKSEGFRRWSLVDDLPAVHTGFGICELDPGGSIDSHLHSFEESFFLVDGQVVCETGEGAFTLEPGDYGVVTVGVPHRWRNESDSVVRWAEMLAPQPRADGDTFFAPLPVAPGRAESVDPRDPRTRSFGHISAENMEPERQTQDVLLVSASMRTALLVYSGITVKMMVDSDLGAQLSTMFMVQYVPGGLAGAHDHPFEETYLIVEGEVDGYFDGHHYRLGVGDVAFAGVGCVHEFSNPTDGIVRWLETQAPQPPARHSYRFARDWTYLRQTLG